MFAGDLAELKAISLDIVPELSKMRDIRHGNPTLLYTAARQGHVSIVAWLLQFPEFQNPAVLNARQASGSTPLHGAAFAGHVDTCKVRTGTPYSLVLILSTGVNYCRM